MIKKFWKFSHWEIAVLLNYPNQSGLGVAWYFNSKCFLLTLDLLVFTIHLVLGSDLELDTDEKSILDADNN